MLKRIRVRDIQSLADVDLELGQVTVIVGPSRSGKSALVRALRACLFNWTPGPRFVRAGAASGEVTLDFEEASVTWEKPAKGGASYRLRTAEGEQLLTRLGRELPQNVAELTGIRELQVDGVRIRPNFDCQHDEPFLLASTGGQAAKLLAHVSKMDDVVRAQVEAKRDRDRTERLASDAESRAETVRTDLEAMPDYPALLTRWESLQERHRAAQQAQDDLDAAHIASGRLRRLLALRAGWKDAALPDRTAGLTGRAEALVRAAGVIAERAKVAARLEGMRRQLAEAQGRLHASEERLHGVLDSLEQCPICERRLEHWRPVVPFPGVYEVSDLGRVRRVKAGQGARVAHVLKPRSDGHHCGRAGCKGWVSVLMHDGDRKLQKKVHQLVSQAFLPPQPPGTEVNHRDGDGTNNAVDNLEWATRSENQRHAYDVLGRYRVHPPSRAKLTLEQVHEIKALAGTMTQAELASRFGVAESSIGRVIRGEAWRNAP